MLFRGKNPAEMEMEFLEKVSQFYTYGAELIVVKVIEIIFIYSIRAFLF